MKTLAAALLTIDISARQALADLPSQPASETDLVHAGQQNYPVLD